MIAGGKGGGEWRAGWLVGFSLRGVHAAAAFAGYTASPSWIYSSVDGYRGIEIDSGGGGWRREREEIWEMGRPAVVVRLGTLLCAYTTRVAFLCCVFTRPGG